MNRAVFNEGVINGHCITGDKNNFFNFYFMSGNVSEVIINLAQSQAKLADAIAESINKRSEADLIRAATEKQCAENQAVELKIREKEAENNSTLIQSIHDTLLKINKRLEK